MSLVIDENAIRRLAEATKGQMYSVTALNLDEALPDRMSERTLYPSQVASTVPLGLRGMSTETVERLLAIRRQIVASGDRLMSTTELDDEVAERKGYL